MRGKNLFGMTMVVALFASLFAISPISTAQTLPRMYLDPSATTVDAGTIFTLSVYVENVNDMYAWEFKIKNDIKVTTFLAPPKEGPFLKSGGYSTFFAWTYNPQSGVLMVGNTRLGSVPGVSGTGKIAEISYIAETPGAGTTTTIDLYDEKKYDSNLLLIPEAEPGDAQVTIQWPPELWNTELWLSSAHGGKIWTEWQVGTMVLDPFYGVVYTWEPNVVYARIRNTGTVGIYVRVWLAFTSEGGVTEDWDPYEDIPLTTESGYINPSDDIVVKTDIGVVDPLWIVTKPPFLVFESGTFTVTGQLQISLDSMRWYNWADFSPSLPGDGFSRVTPGGDTGKFKVTPP